MSRILKSPYILLDNENKISIDVATAPQTEESAKSKQPVVEQEKAEDILGTAKKASSKILAEAEIGAKKIIEEAQQTAKQLKADAQNEGRNIGHAEGYTKGVAEAEKIKTEAEKIRQEAIAERERLLSTTEPDIVNLITSILNKLLTDTVNINQDVIICLIKQGLSGTKVQGDVSIHVSEDDYESVLNNKEAFLSLTDASAQVNIVKDYSLSKSGCIIETTFGVIDCSLDMQFKALKDNLYYILKNG